MDYTNYTDLLKHYNELDETDFKDKKSQDELISALIDISREKKQIQTQCNAIIQEYIIKYEKYPELIDDKAIEMLQGFFGILLSDSGQILDPPIAFCIAKILFRYYQSTNDLEQTVLMLQRCTVLDIILKEHLDDYAGTSYMSMIEEYMARFDELSEKSQSLLINCRLLSVINRKDMTFGLKQYRKVNAEYQEMQKRMGEQFMKPQFIMCQSNALAFALEACRRAEYAKKSGATLDEPVIDMEKEAPLIAELGKALEAVLSREDVQSLISDRVVISIYCVQAAYHTGAITIEELLDKLEEYSKPQEDHNTMEQCSALFTANAYYMDYLYKSCKFDNQYVLDKSKEIVEHVLETAKGMVHQFGNYQINHCILMLVYSASNIIDFDSFKTTLLNATVYANKALFVHTMMVKEIALVLLSYILEHNPKYLDGVAGYSSEYCKQNPKQLLDLMENCALFHDIGKYFCLDYVSNSSRNLTDDEFGIIKAHPVNFSKIYNGKMNAKTECIYDCALLHHVWYNECGGYPAKKHTKNKPFVNILSIADSIDAATDNIGRPYGVGKTLEQLMGEFDAAKDTRYCGYIADLLHIPEVKEKVEYILQNTRKEIYCCIYQGDEV
ncbi:MAG: hypothetical protein NC433_08970 [Clostridiales bacterium]|nr:hypothetical protein [Clostridiales bacterium]